VETVTDSLPEVAFVPDQVPDAEQEEALVEDQVRVAVFVKRTEVGFADRFTVGVGVGDPPPPPPPQAETIDIVPKKHAIFLNKSTPE
jgi:hypothetical protein